MTPRAPGWRWTAAVATDITPQYLTVRSRPGRWVVGRPSGSGRRALGAEGGRMQRETGGQAEPHVLSSSCMAIAAARPLAGAAAPARGEHGTAAALHCVHAGQQLRRAHAHVRAGGRQELQQRCAACQPSVHPCLCLAQAHKALDLGGVGVGAVCRKAGWGGQGVFIARGWGDAGRRRCTCRAGATALPPPCLAPKNPRPPNSSALSARLRVAGAPRP